MKSFDKSVENSNNPKTGFKSPNQMRPSIFSGGKQYQTVPKLKFNTSKFRTQHKG